MLALLPGRSAPDSGPLRIGIVYSPAFDSACALATGNAIPPVGRAQLEAMLPSLRAAWAAEGRPVLDRVQAMTGKGLRGGSLTVRATLCDIPSSSPFGTIVNMRHALPAFTRDPVPLRYKVAVIDHELLHRLLADIDLSGSRMLGLHRREPRRVLSHLHLFALLKAAWIDRGRADIADEARRIDSGLPQTAYRRAWAIVDSSPTAYRDYVEEVRLAR